MAPLTFPPAPVPSSPPCQPSPTTTVKCPVPPSLTVDPRSPPPLPRSSQVWYLLPPSLPVLLPLLSHSPCRPPRYPPNLFTGGGGDWPCPVPISSGLPSGDEPPCWGSLKRLWRKPRAKTIRTYMNARLGQNPRKML